jgi:hypothetical protein
MGKGIDRSLNYFTRSSQSRWVGQTNGENDEARIVKVWPSKRPHLRLGLIITMVGLGI